MRKPTIKLLLTSIVLIISLVLTIIMLMPDNRVLAVTSDDGLGAYTVSAIKAKNEFKYTTHVTDLGISTLDNEQFSQQVNVFTQKQTANSKVVTWAVSTASGFTRMPVSAIAEDYQRKHPGWIVVGGINADQYYQYSGDAGTANGSDYFIPQPYYPMIADGEAWFSITVTPYGAQNVAGFLQNGEKDPIIAGSANWSNGEYKVNGLTMKVYDGDDNLLTKHFVSTINETPRAGETAVWTSYNQSLDNKIYYPTPTVYGNLYKVKATLAYMSNSIDYTYKQGNNNQNAFFGKGTITEKCDSVVLEKGIFAIETTDPYITQLLDVGQKVVVEYQLSDGLSEVESAIGYHTIQRVFDTDIPSDAAYNTRKYPRSLFGCTEDGDIVLITVDGNQASKGMCGTSHNETNAVLKYYNCVEAYQMDGGGSVTAVVRNESGKFITVNSPSDSAPRSVLSALLVVEKAFVQTNENAESVINNKELFEQAGLIIKQRL